MRSAINPSEGHDSTGRRIPLPILGAGMIVMGLLTIPADPALSRWIRAIPITNDPARELEFLGQFGQLTSVVLVFVLIALLDPARWRRVFDWGLAGGLVWVVTISLKMGLGRARPRVEDLAGQFLGPFRTVDLGNGPERAFGLGQATSANLWSMPSNHAAFAAVLAVLLACLYPRLRVFAWVLMGIVCFSRVQSGAHYVSDVLIGAGLAVAVAGPLISGYWGVRLLDALWIRLIDPEATPAYPAVRQANDPGATRGQGDGA